MLLSHFIKVSASQVAARQVAARNRAEQFKKAEEQGEPIRREVVRTASQQVKKLAERHRQLSREVDAAETRYQKALGQQVLAMQRAADKNVERVWYPYSLRIEEERRGLKDALKRRDIFRNENRLVDNMFIYASEMDDIEDRERAAALPAELAREILRIQARQSLHWKQRADDKPSDGLVNAGLARVTSAREQMYGGEWRLIDLGGVDLTSEGRRMARHLTKLYPAYPRIGWFSGTFDPADPRFNFNRRTR